MPDLRTFVLGCLLSTSAWAATTTTVVDVPSGNATQRFLYVRPDAPIANLVTLPGGDGELNIQNDGTMTSLTAQCNPPARTRQALADHGLAVALVDSASNGRIYNYDDVFEVIRYMRAHDDVPVWVVGGSSSTHAIANIGAKLPSDMRVGVVFFSPDVVPTSEAVLVARPTLVIYHVLDSGSFPGMLSSGLTSAPVKQQVGLSGGSGGGCGYHLYNGIEGAFVSAISDFINSNNASTGPLPNLDQHGLGGLWYKPVTSGQGFALEVYPDLSGAGQGLIAGGWFTYDIGPAGGADKQRWYSISGPMTSGATTAAVTIYQNVGGNFDAPPMTNAQPVGTGTLAFPTCDATRLTYNMNDGRHGAMAMSRITSNVECSLAPAAATNADFGFSGNWFSPSTSGQGLVLEVNPTSSVLFFAWYTYAPNAAASGVAGQRWYTGQGGYTAGARSVAVTLYQTTGGIFDVITPASQSTVPVGTATLTFASCTSASLHYAFDSGPSAGLSGTIALQRAGPAPAGCLF